MAEERDDAVTASMAAALHGLLDADGPAPGAGDPLPPLWHWLVFVPDAPQRHLGPDGHPKLGGFLPPTRLRRRMFAGGRINLTAAVAVGQPLHRHSLVTSVTEKSGRSGDLVFVEITHDLSAGGRQAITEVQDLVYRGSQVGAGTGRDGQVAGAGDHASDTSWSWRHELATDPTLLFRFSALTYNAHRIHYDRAYATEVEGYPGLVVHGPLQAIALAELCRRHVGDRHVVSFVFRARRPAFDGSPLQLRGRLSDDDHVELEAIDDTGQPTMTAQAVLRPRSI
ncbi:MAG: HTD2 family dehydratase [Acidimicrobiales bacterium]